MHARLKAPFPYFGGKSRVADIVWSRFGDVTNYVEPFFGSGAVLLSRPTPPKTETVNDADAFVSNFWRALAADPDGVARLADWPVNETDLHARHLWLVNTGAERLERLASDPDYFDAKAAAWWAWGKCCWIGSGWCVPRGNGVPGKRPHLLSGKGVNAERALSRQIPHLGSPGAGLNSKQILSGDEGKEFDRLETKNIAEYFRTLAARLRRVRVCCGDWSRVTGPSVTFGIGLTGVFLDPPYASDRCGGLYARDSMTVSADVRKWALANGDNPKMRIALCGHEGEHAMPENWECVAWKAAGGYGSQGNGRGRENRDKERIWFSPHCLKPGGQLEMFAA